MIYLYDYRVCPKCEHVKLVPYDDSLKIIDHYVDVFNKLFINSIKNYNKLHIVTNAFWYREKQIRKFLEKYSTIDIARLVSSSLLIRRIMQKNDFLGTEAIDDSKFEKIIETYAELIKFEEDKSRLEARNWSMIQLSPYDIDHLERLPLKDSIIVCPNENYDRIMETFAKYGMMNEKDAEEKMKKWSKNVLEVQHGSNKSHTSKETIQRFYELISMFYVSFFRSKIYTEAFGFPDSSKITFDPIDLKRLIALYVIHPEGISATNYNDFRTEAIAKFGGKFVEFFKYFVMSEDNMSAIPLFLKYEDKVLLSQAFTELYSYVLHAIMNKEEFNEETLRRSKIYESQIVKEYFEKNGFRYILNHIIKDKMQIDGIAINDSQVFVIEAKGWGTKKLLEEKTSKSILDKEIRNAIDGIHVVVDSGKTTTRPSLPKKVSYVKENKKQFKILDSAQVQGMLVITEVPSILEYQNCKVVFIDDFEYIKTGIRRV
jgi:hypothetical protein